MLRVCTVVSRFVLSNTLTLPSKFLTRTIGVHFRN